MSYCAHCGTQLKSYETQCPVCGTPVSGYNYAPQYSIQTYGGANAPDPFNTAFFRDDEEEARAVTRTQKGSPKKKGSKPSRKAYREEEEEVGISRFTGGAFSLYFRNLLAVIVSFITLSFAAYAMRCWLERWKKSHTYIDGRQLSFDGKGYQLFGMCVKWVLLSIITIGIYTFFLPTRVERWYAQHTHFA